MRDHKAKNECVSLGDLLHDSTDEKEKQPPSDPKNCNKDDTPVGKIKSMVDLLRHLIGTPREHNQFP